MAENVGRVAIACVTDPELADFERLPVPNTPMNLGHSCGAFGPDAALCQLGRITLRFDALELGAKKYFGVHGLAVCKSNLIRLAAGR